MLLADFWIKSLSGLLWHFDCQSRTIFRKKEKYHLIKSTWDKKAPISVTGLFFRVHQKSYDRRYTLVVGQCDCNCVAHSGSIRRWSQNITASNSQLVTLILPLPALPGAIPEATLNKIKKCNKLLQRRLGCKSQTQQKIHSLQT
jgi:hypothetical protein